MYKDKVISNNKRMFQLKTSHGKRNSMNLLWPKQPELRSGTAATYEMTINNNTNFNKELIHRRRPGTQGHLFPEDFCIENTLNQYPDQFQAKYNKTGFKEYIKKSDYEEDSESIKEEPAQKLTEMILHMKGPMYSTAERNFESINSTMDQFSKRMYLSKANPNRFFRQPIQVYPSLLLTNPSKSLKRKNLGKDCDYTASSPLKKITRVLSTSLGKRAKKL